MASPIDLVTLAQVQAYVGGAAGVPQAKLGQLITSVSMAIVAATNRSSILPKTYTEVRDGSPRGIMLRNWPVISVASVTVGSSGTTFGPSVNGALGYLIDTPDDPPAGSPQMLTAPFGGIPRGDANVVITYTAGYQITGEPQTAGASVAVVAPFGAWGLDQGVSYAAGGALAAVQAGKEALGAYSVSGGTYTFSAADAGAPVLISYGFIPADLANAALEWIADRLAYQDRIGVASKSLGGQETVSFRIGATPDFVKAMVANYTNQVPIV